MQTRRVLGDVEAGSIFSTTSPPILDRILGDVDVFRVMQMQAEFSVPRRGPGVGCTPPQVPG
eukprot:5696707-Pyramimonas_sp.AAC.1